MASENDSPPSQCVPAAPSVVATPDLGASSSPGAPSAIATLDPQASSSPRAPSVVATPDTGASTSPPVVSLLRRIQRGPMGLRNPSQTSCYLNSVLQCLTFTPPLAEYCRQGVHSTTCTGGLECTLCILEKRIRKSLQSALKVDTPANLNSHVINSKLFEPGRQEDAHELLSFLINSCGKAVEAPLGNGKSVLDKLFGGVLQSQIVCQECNTASTKHEEMLDLSLNICNLGSLEEALTSLFRQEDLDGDNKYHCEGCDRLSAATKQTSIYEMPKVLTIQLQRFDPLSGNKLQHFVKFNGQLSVAEYRSQKFPDVSVAFSYKLYAVIEHVGDSPESGHYVAAVKETNGTWYLCDDDDVLKLKEESILKANAYLLFYIRSDVTANDYL